jgi:hypothetical protein
MRSWQTAAVALDESIAGGGRKRRKANDVTKVSLSAKWLFDDGRARKPEHREKILLERYVKKDSELMLRRASVLAASSSIDE